MGRDKALIEVGGVALARAVADGLAGAGCDPVVAVGGDADALVRVGLTVVPDERPGDGPLAGLASALGAATAAGAAVAVVAPCDLLHPGPVASLLLDGLATAPDAPVAVPVVDGVPQWIHAAWRVDPALRDRITDRLDAGDRRLDMVAQLVAPLLVTVPAALMRDADEPSDLGWIGSPPPDR